MPRLHLADLDLSASAVSPLGNCLLEINAKTTQPPEPAERSATGKTGWQDRWSSNQEQISRRLELIEVELGRLSVDGEDAPKLSLFAD